MSDARGGTDAKREAPIRLRSNITGHAKGSQPLLIVFAMGGVLLVLAGIGLAPFFWVGYLGLTIGVLLLSASLVMWHKSQPDVDRGPGDAVPAEIAVGGSNGIRVAGPGALVHAPATWEAIARVLPRLTHQVPLPPAAGLVDPQDPNTVKQHFTPSEAQADAEELQALVTRDQRRLLDLLREHPRSHDASLSQGGRPALAQAPEPNAAEGATEHNRLADNSTVRKK
jgi:hypothetical protein